jgi:putative transposase
MPQSFANVLLHIVFSTMHRKPYLNAPQIRESLVGYIIGTLANIECQSLQTNCVDDHIHILCHISRTISIAKLVEQIKTSSSKWIKEEYPGLADFHWQAGYGAFSVSQSNVEQVKLYIINQEEHHRKMTFQEEFRELLRRHGLECDEKYVWD